MQQSQDIAFIAARIASDGSYVPNDDMAILPMSEIRNGKAKAVPFTASEETCVYLGVSSTFCEYKELGGNCLYICSVLKL